MWRKGRCKRDAYNEGDDEGFVDEGFVDGITDDEGFVDGIVNNEGSLDEASEGFEVESLVVSDFTTIDVITTATPTINITINILYYDIRHTVIIYIYIYNA